VRTALITIAAGRREHLRRQHAAVSEQHAAPDLYLCVTMGDPEPPALSGLAEIRVPSGPELPLAAARNAGAATAIRNGAELLIFLDVDCIPGSRLVSAYQEAAAGRAESTPVSALCGPVGYLPPLDADRRYRDWELAAVAVEHPDRVITEADTTVDINLFWSLSFAMSTGDWNSVGGFDERYTGYGGEDTDFAQKLVQTGGRLAWAPEARAYHQHHESHDPPLRHVESIVRNANTFRRRWGWFPMADWLNDFERLGLATFDPTTDRWGSSQPPPDAERDVQD
jgi:N-acetylglucosaminyl-diphospho-decaprenol L-rhamnosyltransferase